ncbi:cell division protein FtsW (lipid II flippase) [Variovorax boronicumulans]|uniref:FtsW/RodA/SpoVE family cell cycle protein n=1 Tax=Variovorax boronicumulans TaxID=436515 RepID=UPI002782C1F2|nr:FtsW/RodA/SpoVE family cell cycle protein [Variovorax boronicumulans]MDP9912396.1 cell division protein FtsW (lipid II flippase) [Variovorax boronicumulans]
MHPTVVHAPIRSAVRRDMSAIGEFVLLVLVLIVLVWQFQGLRHGGADAPDDDRYRLDQALQAAPLVSYGHAQVATLCHAVDLPPRLRWRWAGTCASTRVDQAGSVQALPAALQADQTALQQAITAGAAERMARVAPLAKSLAEGVLPDAEQAQLADTARELTTYRARYQLGHDPSTGSLPLACAWIEALAAAQRADSEPEHTVALANQLAIVHGAAARLWWPSTGPAFGWSTGATPECRALGTPQRTMALAADLARQVRNGERLAHKSAAMQTLTQRAPWLLIAWSLLTWGLVSLARRTRRPLRFLPPALLAWAAMGAASGLAQPDAGAPIPWWVWVSMATLGVVVAIVGRSARLERFALFAPCASQRSVVFFGLPLAVFFIGVGWWLVFDLALNGHVLNRYIALRHSLAVFGAMVLLSVLPAMSQGIATLWLRWASLITNALRPGSGSGVRAWRQPVLLWGLYAAVVLSFALLTTGWRQLTGELLPLLLLLGVSWFFLLRAALWTRSQGGAVWLATSVLPLLVHLVIVLAALVLTDDLGPTLVVLFASAIYAGAFVAQGLLGRGARWPLAAGIGILAALLLAGALLAGLYVFTKLPGSGAERVAQRLDAVINPFSAENDQLAHVLWLGQHTPPSGYGLGAVPWCGSLPVGGCPGVPAQAQSDYSFAVLHAVAGNAVSFSLLATYLLWLGLLSVRHAAQTRGRLNPGTPGASQGAWLAWLCVCWAVLTMVQTMITVAGNLGALPLTGVTWPFVSFGLWSLLRNSLVLGLVMNRPEIAE